MKNLKNHKYYIKSIFLIEKHIKLIQELIRRNTNTIKAVPIKTAG